MPAMVRSRLVLLAAAALLLADEADACTPDPCEEVLAFVDLKRASDLDIPTDGVALLQANWFGDIAMLPLLPGLAATVYLKDDESGEEVGEEVEGQLEETDVPGTLLWRPALPLVPEATYVLRGTYENPAEAAGVCAPQFVEFKTEFKAGADPSLPLFAPEVRTRTEFEDFPRTDLGSLACCDGAVPRAEDFCGVTSLSWTEGQCTTTVARKVYKVDLWIDVLEEEEPSYGQWMYTLREDGAAIRSSLIPRFTRYLTEPACYVFEMRSLISGVVFSGEETCFGEELVDFEDEQPLDPHQALGDSCDGPLYTCDIVGDRWDRDHCRSWTPTGKLEILQARKSACAVAGDGEPGSLPWLLGAWLIFTRGSDRRRRSSSRRGS